MANTELSDIRIIICLRKSKVSVERISVCKVIENLMEHGIQFLPCSYISEVINMLLYYVVIWCLSDVTKIAFCQVLSMPVFNSLVAMITDLWCHLTDNLRGAWHTLYAMHFSNYQWDATWNSYNGTVLFSQTYNSFSTNLILLDMEQFCLLWHWSQLWIQVHALCTVKICKQYYYAIKNIKMQLRTWLAFRVNDLSDITLFYGIVL